MSIVTGSNFNNHSHHVQHNHNTSIVEQPVRVLEIIKNSTITNNKKGIDITKNGNNFLAPRIQNPSVHEQSLSLLWLSLLHNFI